MKNTFYKSETYTPLWNNVRYVPAKTNTWYRGVENKKKKLTNFHSDLKTPDGFSIHLSLFTHGEFVGKKYVLKNEGYECKIYDVDNKMVVIRSLHTKDYINTLDIAVAEREAIKIFNKYKKNLK